MTEPRSGDVTIGIGKLTRLVDAALTRSGLAAEASALIAQAIVAAEIDGSRSHGIHRVPGYAGSLASGWVDGNAVPVVEDVAAGLVRVDACNGFAQPAIRQAADLLAGKAAKVGVAAMAIRNSHHFAALWQDVEAFAERGFVALNMVNSRSRMVVWNGQSKVLGTNPVAFACPRRGQPPICWDQATSVMSHGDVLLSAAAGLALPQGVGLDAHGRDTTDAKAVAEGGALLPFGGVKGGSIAFMVEVFAAALTGSNFGFEDDSASFPGARTSRAGQFILLVDPSRIAGGDFAARMETLIEAIRTAGTARIPSEQRYRRRAVALRAGEVFVNEASYRSLLEHARPAGPSPLA